MLKKLSQCMGLSSLILVMNYGDLLGGGSDVRMHVPFALNGIVYAQLADIALLGVVLFAILGPMSRMRWYPWAQMVVAMVVPPYLVERTRLVLPFHLPNGVLIALAVTWMGLVVLLRVRYRRGYRGLMSIGNFAGVFLGVFALFSVVQLLHVARWRPGPHALVAAWSAPNQPARVHPLLVWVIFDELSYDQVYEHRAADLSLPNFDALRGESTVYSDVQPIGDKTVKVVPSLLSGQIVNAYRFGAHNHLQVHDADVRGFHALDGAGTVFGDAKRAGWRTAAVGWYNPYCTLYGNAIDACYWMNRDMIDGPMAQDASFARNVYTPLRQMGDEMVHPAKAREDVCSFDVRERYKTFIDLKEHTTELLRGDQADFVFLHLPVPHSPNIWSRKSGGYTQRCGSSYLDALALADRELGSVMGILQSSPRWNDTTLIVQGDHSWRTYVWDDEAAWTAEDAAASHDHFDPRPAVIVHAAGQTHAEVKAVAWPVLNVHEIVEQVLRGKAVQ